MGKLRYLLTPFKERQNDKDSAKEAHKEEKEIFSNFDEEDKSRRYGYYFASKGEIMTKGVPYDTQFGSSDFDLGLSGNAHRFRTLGHDPLLGWVFGTSNIMTNTLTLWSFESYHVKPGEMANGKFKSKIVSRADTLKIFEYVSKRFQDDPVVLAMALIKQRLHLKSDMFSTVGLPIPGISALSPDIAQSLAKYGIDTASIYTIGKQATYAAFINLLIAIIHGFFYDESIGSKRLYEVRTRKILSYSNLIASASNLIGVAIAEVVATSTGNTKLGENAIRYLDIGGLVVTIYRIVNDKKFIQQIKHEFLEKEFYDMVMGKEIL